MSRNLRSADRTKGDEMWGPLTNKGNQCGGARNGCPTKNGASTNKAHCATCDGLFKDTDLNVDGVCATCQKKVNSKEDDMRDFHKKHEHAEELNNCGICYKHFMK